MRAKPALVGEKEGEMSPTSLWHSAAVATETNDRRNKKERGLALELGSYFFLGCGLCSGAR